MSTEPIIHALAELRRLQIIEAKVRAETQNLYPDAYAYAVANSIYPFHHEDAGLLEHQGRLDVQFPFRRTYAVSYEQISELGKLLDDHWRAKDKITFYDLEDHYAKRQWTGPSLRMDLIHCCRYMYLDRLFDPDFWEDLLSNAPIEAHGINDPFTPEELRPF